MAQRVFLWADSVICRWPNPAGGANNKNTILMAINKENMCKCGHDKEAHIGGKFSCTTKYEPSTWCECFWFQPSKEKRIEDIITDPKVIKKAAHASNKAQQEVFKPSELAGTGCVGGDLLDEGRTHQVDTIEHRTEKKENRIVNLDPNDRSGETPAKIIKTMKKLADKNDLVFLPLFLLILLVIGAIIYLTH